MNGLDKNVYGRYSYRGESALKIRGGFEMKKVLSVVAILAILSASLFAFTGCGDKKNGGDSKKAEDPNKVQISYVNGKGTFKVSVPKKDDGSPKYEFTEKKPEASKFRGTFYIETDKAVITFATSGLAYNTSKDYKAKYGETKATFDGYLEFMDDPSSTIPKNNTEKLEINGRKAVKRESREGSSGNYKYYGFNYMIAGDDIYPGSYISLGVYYKGEEVHTSADAIDEETQAIINSLVVSLNS